MTSETPSTSAAKAIRRARLSLAMGRGAEAVGAFAEALGGGGGSFQDHFDFAVLLHGLGRHVEATGQFDRACATPGATHEGFHNLARLCLKIGDARRASEAFAQAIFRGAGPEARSDRLFALNFESCWSESWVLEEHRREVSESSPPSIDPQDRRSGWVDVVRDEERPLRVGFVSGDLRSHPIASFLVPLLRGLNGTGLRAVAYSNAQHADQMTDLIRSMTSDWRDVRWDSAERVAELVLRDRIDVLVDLSGHTSGHRLDVFRLRPAPVQVTWLGYPNTTALPEIGWRLVDSLTDPPGSELLASESLLRMEPPFLCFDGLSPDVEIPPRPARAPIFGSFNRLAKLSDACLSIWARTLAAVPTSSLLLKAPGLEDPLLRESTLNRLESFGIAQGRVELRPPCSSREAHYRAYADLDVALDSYPYHGTTTTCEALWNGVPVISRIGGSHRCRVAKTLLAAVDLPELACHDDDQFISAAVSLAADPARRHGLHGALRHRMKHGTLCDERGFARRFEVAIRHAWGRWCRGQPPEHAFVSSAAARSSAP